MNNTINDEFWKRNSSMDYFVYDRTGSIDGKSGPAHCFVFTCPECLTRLWGVWRFKTNLGYTEEDLCFCEGFQKMRQEQGQKIPIGEYAQYRQIDEYRQEALKFIETTKCPLCGAKLTKANLRYWGTCPKEIARSWNVSRGSFEYWSDSRQTLATVHSLGGFGDTETLVRYYRMYEEWHAEAKGRFKYEEFIQQCAAAKIRSKKFTLQSKEQLASFLKCLVDVEKNIYTVSARLKELYKHEYMDELYAKHSEKKPLIKKIAKLQAELKQKQEEPISTAGWPEKPVAPKAPEEPILKKPGLFNKKRVLAQNAALTTQYERACAQHVEEMKKYDADLISFNETVKHLKAEFEKQRSKACKKIEKKCKVAQQECLELSESKISTPEMRHYKATEKEISQANELLEKLYTTRKQMYASGIIFNKYHDFVAISSFYEYLSSGRCTSLDGANGAYNLYENEIRMDMIITQLGTVAERLEQIQKNQYVLYSAIKEATNELQVLNKTTTELAQNTRMLAFYAKKNAELTETLCFLTALK